jgi:hypothetical protein
VGAVAHPIGNSPFISHCKQYETNNTKQIQG